MNIQIEQLDKSKISVKDLSEQLDYFGRLLPIPLAERVNVEEYAKKVYNIGIVLLAKEAELNFYWNKSIELLKKKFDLYHFDDVGIDSGVMIQEMILGDEYGLDVVNDLNGNFVTTFVEKKLEMRGGETDAAVVVDSPMLFELGKQIGSQSGHIGNLDVDVVVRDQIPYIIEMNPRFGGHYPFAHLAGANIPAALLAWAAGNEPNNDWFKVRYGFRACKELHIRPYRV